MIEGENFLPRGEAGVEDSGRRSTSSARARLGSLRMKPRSSSARISRWMPDFERRSSASFISSKEGGTPASFSRSWMKRNNSLCFLVSIGSHSLAILGGAVPAQISSGRIGVFAERGLDWRKALNKE